MSTLSPVSFSFLMDEPPMSDGDLFFCGKHGGLILRQVKLWKLHVNL